MYRENRYMYNITYTYPNNNLSHSTKCLSLFKQKERKRTDMGTAKAAQQKEYGALNIYTIIYKKKSASFFFTSSLRNSHTTLHLEF